MLAFAAACIWLTEDHRAWSNRFNLLVAVCIVVGALLTAAGLATFLWRWMP